MLYTFICSITIFFCSTSFQDPLPDAPPGTYKVGDLWVDKTELSNIAWLEFLHFRGLDPDSAELYTLFPKSENFWYELPQNRFKPIAYITYEQAQLYCIWRSKVVNEMFGTSITYRLPTAHEWKKIAEQEYAMNRRKNIREWKDYRRQVKSDTAQYLTVKRYKVEGRIFDLFGNVSEMTSEKGVAMGGNNLDILPIDNTFMNVILYDEPHAYLGFRCVVEDDGSWARSL